MLTSVAVLAAQIAPPRRRAEALGTMGLGGFTGMVIGPTVGDYIFSGDTGLITPYRIFFCCSAACCLASALIIALLPSPRVCGGRAQPEPCSPASGPGDSPRSDRSGFSIPRTPTLCARRASFKFLSSSLGKKFRE